MSKVNKKAYTRTEAEYEELECQLEEIKQKRQGSSLNEMMEWSVKELAELVLDLVDENDELETKLKALLIGLEVQHIDNFISKANSENYKQLGERITLGFKAQLKEKGE